MKLRCATAVPFVCTTGALGRLLIFFCVFALTSMLHSQSAPNVTSLKAQQAFSSNAQELRSLHLSGGVSWTAGSTHQDGTVDLRAGSDGSQSETWTIGDSSYAFSAPPFSEGHTCTIQNAKGESHAVQDSNCARPVSWFAPWLSWSLLKQNSVDEITDAQNPSTLSYTAHLADFNDSSAQNTAVIRRLTKTDVVIDATSNLVTSVSFDYQINGDPAHAVAYRIEFSDYRADGGVMIAHHIQRFVQNTLQADITINSVTVE